MGIRIHKSLGYGLTDVEKDDPRINWGSFLLTGEGDRNDVGVYNGWLMMAKDRDDLSPLDAWWLNDHAAEQRRVWMTDCIAYSPEYGLPNVLVLRPLACRDWSRYDDAIDYVVATHLEGPEQSGNRVEVLKHQIYPFSHYVDAITGEQITGDVYSWWRLQGNLFPSSPSEVAQIEQSQDTAALRLGYDGNAEARERVVPKVPDEIRMIAEYADLFTDPDTVRALRPMLYTYWS